MRSETALCPLCGTQLGLDGSDDHVFGEAFGGRATVRAHKDCNNELGGGPEGRLHRGPNIANFVASMRGIAVEDVPGTMADGTQVTTNFADGSTSLARPIVDRIVDSENVRLSVIGRPEHLKKVLKDWRSKYGEQVPRYNELTPEQLQTVEFGIQEVEYSLYMLLEDAEAFAVKAALGAGVLGFGVDFAGSEVAGSLREWASSPFDNPLTKGSKRARRYLEMLDALDELYAGQTSAMALNGLTVSMPSIVPSQDSGASQVAFVPLPGGSGAVVFVHVLGMPLPPYGLVVSGEMPKSSLDMASPFVVREVGGKLEMFSVVDRIMLPVIEAARKSAQEVIDREVAE